MDLHRKIETEPFGRFGLISMRLVNIQTHHLKSFSKYCLGEFFSEFKLILITFGG